MPLVRGGTWLAGDGLGSITALMNGSGGATGLNRYEPFGELSPGSTGGSSLYQFTGRDQDGTGLMYYRARYYAPEWGRFISEDPIGLAGGLNSYAYAGNNPLKFTDPSGMLTPDNVVDGLLFTGDLLLLGYDYLTDAPAGVKGNDLFWAGVDLGATFLPGATSAPWRLPQLVHRAAAIAEAYSFEQRSARALRAGYTYAARAGCGGENSAAEYGRQVHSDFAEKVGTKEGWQSEPRIEDPQTGKYYKPDAVTPGGHPIELKPDTPSGHRAGARQLKIYERILGKKGRVIYYTPSGGG
jgi:RHS repeat-associated protein